MDEELRSRVDALGLRPRGEGCDGAEARSSLLGGPLYPPVYIGYASASARLPEERGLIVIPPIPKSPRSRRGLTGVPALALVAGAGLLALIGRAGSGPATGSSDASVPAAEANRRIAGRIEGNVIISAALSSRRPRFRIYADAGPGSAPRSLPRPDSIAELKNIVIYLEPARPGAASATLPAVRPAIEQVEEQFMPHVLPVVRGTTVEFPNRDNVFHNVFSLSGGNAFNLGRYPRGKSESVTFGKVGTVRVLCDIHSDMSAVILVLPNALFTSPDHSGRFVIDGVPAGEYTVTAWHERIKPVSRRLRVVDGETARVETFNIPLPPPPAKQ
jgi:plastocyanin